MMSLGQKAIAAGTVVLLNLVSFLFMGVLTIFLLIPSLMMLGVILKR